MNSSTPLQQSREPGHIRRSGERVLGALRRAGVWLLVLAFPAIWIGAYAYCESMSYPDCEDPKHKTHHGQTHQREPESAPLSILLGETNQSAKREQREPKSEATRPCSGLCKIVARSLDNPVGLFTGILCYVVWLQFIWLTRQETVLSRSVDIAGRVASTSLAQERAYLFIDHVWFDRQSQLPNGDWQYEQVGVFGVDLIAEDHPIAFDIRNYGRTPATLLRLRARVGIFSRLPMEAGDIGAIALGAGHIVPIDKAIGSYAVKPIHNNTTEARQAVKAHQAHLLLYGDIVYRDVFGATWIRGFCWEHANNIAFQPSDDDNLNYEAKPYQHS